MKKPKVFYGYWIVLVGLLILGIYSGSGFFAFSLFVKPLEGEFGWSRGDIMAGFTILYVIMGFSSPFIGRVVDRYGAKKVISMGALVTGLGFAFLSRINNLWELYLGCIIIGIGLAAMGQVPTSAVVSNWFKKRRGLAIGIASMGVGGGGFAIAPLIGGYIIPEFGWRFAYLTLAILPWVIIIPLVLLVIKTKPADMGLYPDGINSPPPEIQGSVSPSASGKLTVKMALSTATFWLIALSFFLSTFSHAGLIQSQVPHLQDIGFPAAEMATALGMVGLLSAFGKFFFGWVCDRIPPKFACSIGLLLQGLGGLVLVNVVATSPPSLIWLYAILMGLGVGSWLPTMSMLTSDSFGLAAYGAIFGAVSLAQGVGTAMGPLVAGRMFDAMNDYHQPFIIFTTLYAIAIPAVLLTRRLKKARE